MVEILTVCCHNVWKLIVPGHEGQQTCQVNLASEHQMTSLYFDGGSRGNPGIAGCGALLCKESGGVENCIWSGGNYLGQQTNNVAEYNGLILGLVAAADLGLSAIEIKGDSKLVINQVMRKPVSATSEPCYTVR